MVKNIGKHDKLDLNKELNLMEKNGNDKKIVFSQGEHEEKGFYQIKIGIYYQSNKKEV